MGSAYVNDLAHTAAVTTLLGSKTAESLTLGSRGAAGLPWAAMSSFGSFYVVKACLAGCVPDWLREVLGVDSYICNTILGKSSRVNSQSMLKAASDNLKGIAVKLTNQNKDDRLSVYNVSEFDENLSGIVRSCPSFQNDVAPTVYAYARDGPHVDTVKDWIAIAASAIKVLESIVLWLYVRWHLSLASTVGWLYFFVAAALLRSVGLSREFDRLVPRHWRQDVLAGDLPTLHGPGQDMRIILDVPVNVRTHLAWRLAWGLGFIVILSSTIATYLLLRGTTIVQFCIWATFQLLWLVARYVFHHFAARTDGRANPIVERKIEGHGYRLLSLAGGVSRNLAQLHPRTSESYLQELHDSFDIRSLICAAKCRFDWRNGIKDDIDLDKTQAAPSQRTNTVDLRVVGIIGDTMLQSLSWIHGSKMTCIDLYDSCLIALKINQQIYLIPSARVLSGQAGKVKRLSTDVEAGVVSHFIPKLGPCRGENNGWVYWIPIDSGRWLYFICDLNSLGEHSAEILDDAEVTRRLKLGNLWVSVTEADELKTFCDRAAFLGRVLVKEFLVGQGSE